MRPWPRLTQAEAGMATPTPAVTEALVRARLADVPHGGKVDAVAALGASIGKSRATVYRHLKATTVQAPRRKRSDAGRTALTQGEAKLISAMVMEGLRKNNKRLYTIGHAVQVLRANGAIRAERVDAATGECIPLSDAAIARAMSHYGLHPDQLLRPPPARELRSLHPNHVWQIDASLCVLYYLETTNPAEMGLQVMEARKFNKNKPRNLKRIEDRRVWSYEVTDHNSGALYVNYVFDGESAANISETFIAAIQQRGTDPFYGVPFILMMDMGSANTSGLFKNLLRRLQVQAMPHAPENARATGQVENARNLLERGFESGLRLRPVHSLDELNARVQRWCRWFNATKQHSRHGKTRAEQWMTIQPEQLRIAPPPERCRELLSHTPEPRKVNALLRVEFDGAEYDVSAVPRVMVGEKLLIARSPYQANAALVVDTDAEGKELLHLVPLVEKGEDGFSLGGHSNVIGEDWRRPADTLADTNRKEVELLAMQAASLEEAAAKRKARAAPFGGLIDPERHIQQAKLPSCLPKRGQALALGAQTAAQPPQPARLLTQFEAAALLAAPEYLGQRLSAEQVALLRSLHPQGVPEDQLPNLAARLQVRGGLRLVAGGQ